MSKLGLISLFCNIFSSERLDQSKGTSKRLCKMYINSKIRESILLFSFVNAPRNFKLFFFWFLSSQWLFVTYTHSGLLFNLLKLSWFESKLWWALTGFKYEFIKGCQGDDSIRKTNINAQIRWGVKAYVQTWAKIMNVVLLSVRGAEAIRKGFIFSFFP